MTHQPNRPDPVKACPVCEATLIPMGREFWACPTDASHVESADAMFARAYKRDLAAGRWFEPGHFRCAGPGDKRLDDANFRYQEKLLEAK